MLSTIIKYLCSVFVITFCVSVSFAQTDATNTVQNDAEISKESKTAETVSSPDNQKPENKTAKPNSNEVEEKKVKWIKDTIQFGVQTERRTAINMVLTIKDESSKEELCDLLVATLKDEYNNDAVIRIITVLGELKVTRAEEQITAKLDDSSEDTVIAAVYALKNMNAIAAKEKLIEKLKQQKLDTDSRLFEPLLSTLGAFKAAELMPFVQEKIKDNTTTSSVREQMTLFLSNIDTPESKEVLKELYVDEEEEILIRCFAVNGLSKLDSKENADDIHNVLNALEAYPLKKRQRYHNLMIYSATALVKLGDDRAVPRLIDYLKSDNAAVRLKAVELIKETGDKRTIDILKYKMKHDSDLKVKKAAENALKSMGVEIE